MLASLLFEGRNSATIKLTHQDEKPGWRCYRADRKYVL